jgi:hypothetical protein
MLKIYLDWLHMRPFPHPYGAVLRSSHVWKQTTVSDFNQIENVIKKQNFNYQYFNYQGYQDQVIEFHEIKIGIFQEI